MPSAAEFVAAAASEIGYVEQRVNRTKFAAEAGHTNGNAWCATFVVAIARRTGVKLPSESAYTPNMAAWFRNNTGAWYARNDSVRPGDIAFFDFPNDSKRRIQHVGIIESATGLTVTCIEGNTSSGEAGSQDNGGGVYRRTRTRAHVVGFGRPTFSSVPAPAPPPSSEHPTVTVTHPLVVGVACPTGGYWLVHADGGVFAFGGAPFLGSLAGGPDEQIVSASATPDGKGLYLFGRDGGVFAFGSAAYAGRTSFRAA